MTLWATITAGRGGPTATARLQSEADPLRKFVWILYADLRQLDGEPERRARMFDILYLAVGVGFFVLMGAYARWAGEA